MIASTHLALGAASGLAIQRTLPDYFGLPERLLAGFALGLITHITADALPHREYMVVGHKLTAVVVFEIVAILFLIYYPIPDKTFGLVMFSALVGAAFPDFLTISYEHLVAWEWVRNWDNYLHTYHGKIPLGFKINLIDQVLLAIALMGFVRLVPH